MLTPQEVQQARQQYGITAPSNLGDDSSSSEPVDHSARMQRLTALVNPQSATQQNQSQQSQLSQQPQLKNPLEDGVLSNLALGAGKGIWSTVKGAANLGEKYLLNPIENLTGEHGFSQLAGLKPGETATDKTIPEGLTEAQGTAQKIGKGAEQLAEFFVPGGAATDVGKAVEGADALSKAPKLAKLLGFGTKLASEGLIGASQQATQQGSADHFLGNAMLFGGMSGVGELAGKAGKYLTQELPGRLINSALKPSVQELEKAVKYGSDTLGDKVAEKGMVGTDKSLYKQAMTAINENENKLQGILKDSPETINKTDLYKYIEPEISKLSKTPGLENEFHHVVDVYSQMPKDMTLSEANIIKRNLYDALNDKAFNLNADLSAKKNVMKSFAKGLKTEIENKTAGTAGEGVVKQINQDLATHGQVAKRALSNMAKEEKKNIIPSLMSHAGYALGGGVAGYHEDGLPGAIAGAGLGLAGEHLFGSTLGKTATARALTVAEKLPVSAVGKLVKPAIVKTIRDKS